MINNPINPAKYIVCLGEIMLRLKSPGFERLLQSPLLDATFGGSESNVAISVVNYGVPSRFVTSLPDNAIGKATMEYLRGFGIETSAICYKAGRMGLYFVEAGSGPRASNVIYDRADSTIATATPNDFNWDRVFENSTWFHISGITPAISQNGADLALYALKEAKKRGLTVSIDFNYRKNLWNYGKDVEEVMSALMPMVDVIIANEEHIQKCLDIGIDQKTDNAVLNQERCQLLSKKVCDKFPQVALIAFSLRESISADYNDCSGLLYVNKEQKVYSSKVYRLMDIVDRIGGGDAFDGGLIYGLYSKMSYQDALEFAVAAYALKHTIPGDANRVTLDEVKKLMAGETSGRIQR